MRRISARDAPARSPGRFSAPRSARLPVSIARAEAYPWRGGPLPVERLDRWSGWWCPCLSSVVYAPDNPDVVMTVENRFWKVAQGSGLPAACASKVLRERLSVFTVRAGKPATAKQRVPWFMVVQL